MDFFAQLNLDFIRHSIVILDIDGTLIFLINRFDDLLSRWLT